MRHNNIIPIEILKGVTDEVTPYFLYALLIFLLLLYSTGLIGIVQPGYQKPKKGIVFLCCLVVGSSRHGLKKFTPTIFSILKSVALKRTEVLFIRPLLRKWDLQHLHSRLKGKFP